MVVESFTWPGANSEAPWVVGEVELFNCVPGANEDAPWDDEPAKLKPDEAINMAAAVTIKVLFTLLSLLSFDGDKAQTLGGVKGSAMSMIFIGKVGN